MLVNNAGIQRIEGLTSGDVADTEATLNTNLLGPMRLTAALLQQLMAQPQGAILNVTSALAMMPAAMMPSYCASEAAMHSYTQSLRYQLRNTPLQVIEIVPQWVQTELQGRSRHEPEGHAAAGVHHGDDGHFEESPESTEILVERAKPMRFAERGDYDTFFHTDTTMAGSLRNNASQRYWWLGIEIRDDSVYRILEPLTGEKLFRHR